MKTQAEFNERMKRCADIVFKQSDAHFGSDRRSSVSTRTLAFVTVAPTMLQSNGFKLWMEYPSVDVLSDWIEKNIGEAPLSFLQEQGVFERNGENQLVLSDLFPKSNMLFSALSCNSWVKTTSKELIGVALKIQRGQIERSDLPYIDELRPQLAAFASGLSHFENTLQCLDATREICEKLIDEGVDQVDFYAANQDSFEKMLDAFFQLEEQCSASEDGTESRLIALMCPGHGVESVEQVMADAAGQMKYLMQQINDNGFTSGASHRG